MPNNFKKLYQRTKGKVVLFDNREPITGKLRAYGKVLRKRAKETIKGISAAAKKVGKGILYGLKGGEYGRRQEERIKKTPEGAKLLESIKSKGFLETYKLLKRK